MMDKHYSEADRDTVLRLTAPEGPVLAVCDFSPGPWWGYNGIQTLVLTSTALHVIQAGLALTRGQEKKVVSVADVREVAWSVEKEKAVSLRLTLHDAKRLRYRSRYRQAQDLAEQVERLIRDR